MRKSSKLKRMSKVLMMAFVIFVKIYWYKITRKPEDEWNKLWGKIGAMFRSTLVELEGLLIKIGQLLSTRADLLPHAFIKQIQDLTDNVPPSSWDEIKTIIEGELEQPIEQYFRSINKKAIASASIGEVYKGVLIDGTDVAIKVQRPNIQSIVQVDFQTLKIIIWFAHHFAPVPKGFINFNMLYQELKLVIERELDYRKELETLLYFKDRFKGEEAIFIPTVFNDLSTSKLLVMEWVEGIKVTDVEELERQGISRYELSQRLMKVFLPQWLEPGMFHADPHQGNVFISKDGKIILLDFGMVGVITKQDAANFQKLIESFLSKNHQNIIAYLSHLGFLLPDADTRIIEKALVDFMSFQPAQLKEMDLISLKIELNDLMRALPIQVPTRFVFLGRAFITIEGMVHQLVPNEDLLTITKPVFLRWLNKEGNHMWTFVWQWLQSQAIFKLYHSVIEYLNMPQKLEVLKETEQRRHFQFTMYENYKKQSYHFLLLGIIGIVIGLYTSHEMIINLSGIVSCIGGIAYFICNHKQKKWLKYMPAKRK